MPRPSALAICVVLPLLLSACVGANPDFDFDFRPTRGVASDAEIAPRPAPDSRGLITYDSYQVAVAQRGDTLRDVAGRIGMDADELARFNGRGLDDALRQDEVLALPRRVTPGAGGTTGGRDITTIARGAIDNAEASGNIAATPAIAVQPGVEPVRHRVGRGETAYSVARLYGVSVRSLADWNGLGPDLAVREGQYVIIPLVISEASTATPIAAPGDSVTPLPPSAASPLPASVTAAVLPAAPTNAGTAVQPAPATAPAAPTASGPRLQRPVPGDIVRPYSATNEGIDIAAPAGTPVRAADAGSVAAITQNTDQISILILRHSNGLLTVYANVSNITVSRGDSVSRGQTVAEVAPGNPSLLHFEVRRGVASLDPADFID
jgi:murein DD-endopeptidase MepM/ murein hydrolase activator NlpD